MKTFRFRQTAVLLFGLFLHVAAARAATINISIQGFAFSPQNPTITAGDTVIWTQNDQTTHTVSSTAAPFPLNSGNLSVGKTFTNTFATPGVFRYQCNIHPTMKGSVTVQAASGATVFVNILGFAFTPQNPTINVGDTVVWTQSDATTHTVSSTAAPFPLNSGNLGLGASYASTFTAAGTFPYRCNIHPSMTGSVIVQAPPNAPPTVSLVAPTNGQVFVAPGNLAVQINAQDDGSVARVDYYRNNVFQQSLAAPPFNFGDNNLPAGNYTLLAVAVDNLGLATTSAPVSIFVVTNCTLVAPQWRAGTASLIVSNAIAGQPYILDSYAQDPGVFPGVWGPLKTNVAPASVFEITDILAPAESRRLYRVRQFFP